MVFPGEAGSKPKDSLGTTTLQLVRPGLTLSIFKAGSENSLRLCFLSAFYLSLPLPWEADKAVNTDL